MEEPVGDIRELVAALDRGHPELDAVRGAAGDRDRIYVVGGAVRDLLLGRARSDLDLVVEGDAIGLASRLGAEIVAHQRFATASVAIDGRRLDLAAARRESYPHPGSLPVVEPASLAEDLGRRDFTINAMAIPLLGEPELIDPHGGEGDLDAGLLRVLHPRSFVDDPTRALRAARYAARFSYAPEEETARLLRQTDLETVSEDRRRAELLRLAAEPTAARGFELLGEWGLVDLRDGGVELAAAVGEILAQAPWHGFADPAAAALAAALGPSGSEERLAAARPQTPSQAVSLARGCDPVELVLARAMGAEWLDRYLSEWRTVSLEIDGDDLIAAGVRQGPAVGRGLQEALRRKLDGELEGREAELAAALEGARQS